MSKRAVNSGDFRLEVARFGRRLRRFRLEAGLSQDALGKATGVQQAWISEVENGKPKMSLEMCMRLAQGVGKDLWELLAPGPDDEEA